VTGFSLSVYLFIFTSCPNLTHLHWSTIRYTDDTDIRPVPLRHTRLKCLYIRTINIQKIESILSCVPNLKQLHIVSDWSRGNNCLPLNFEQLSNLLVRYVPDLNCFNCETMEQNPIDIETIRGFHPCFRCIQFERVPDGRTKFFIPK
jgi:hypothetical protein